jgi:MEDS: MEthanogen/methylotroph, DcmR Sensory domain
MHRCEHLLQVYGRDEALLGILEDFVVGGLENQEAVIVIATRSHRAALQGRLEAAGVDVEAAIAGDRFIALSAQETLDRFMVRGMPDEALFLSTLRPVLARARGPGRRQVRAFGEMVALLWARGNHAATVELELLWNRLLRAEDIRLFCAYPSVGFTPEVSARVHAIRAAHSQVVEG